MSHSEQRSSLEHRRLLRLANEYRQRGYDVILNPSPQDLPPSLADCSLDLVARKGDRTVAAEVRSRESLTLNGPDDLRRISESVKQLPNWEFELVLTNARRKAEPNLKD
ncbi:MAG TPA: hypothetical protein IGS37_08695 [Synechococcales cyanobacterium M55_K2018_004]|nr:hypothetical protein [Synechococcales cyanobacterium M55_K2018_004]